MEIFAAIAFFAGILFVPVFLSLLSFFGLFIAVQERTSVVFTLFGKVIGCIDEAGLHSPVRLLGMRALLVPFFGKRHFVSSSMRQSYLRNQMVNSEEGTPMGVGIWYEMKVIDPEKFLFVNANPDQSLEANVANATVSVLSNLEMETMLEDRHSLSRSVRSHVSPLSEKWGYQLGSVYIRKVAFTDAQMVHDITGKVVKRLVQVTSAMKQDGENRVGLIRSQANRRVSEEMARAMAMRPEVVGNMLNEIGGKDPEIRDAVITVLETEKLIEAKPEVEIVALGGGIEFVKQV
ncbi:SPFH domain-containing protein [Pelagicoccus sp. SDUM812003]|uniref:SPFH domain-containing protein n=1 Tax=Pelagicoccus sp. SDUM812003 TaxID=3041267 RepID=UPI00280D8321|nr:SPFH domain-containing protein [Pelagicoccus sp. SDUM812003]MDQ8204764.1 SPFH domain-containing protein [Pelagicoccus sp. SDUM812003]